MFVGVNLCRLAILLASESVTILCSEMPIVGGAHAVLFLIDGGFVFFEMGGFVRRQLAALDPLCDAGLLIRFARSNVMALGRSGLSKAGSGYGDDGGSKGDMDEFHDSFSVSRMGVRGVLRFGFDQAAAAYDGVDTGFRA
jgi:hypothetical protein